jgi:F5/8 type C domain
LVRCLHNFIKIDLGNVYSINRVKLKWETAYGREYTVQVSSDNINWTKVYGTTTGDGDIDEIVLTDSINARYVTMSGSKRGTQWGYSLYEFEVYGIH